MRRSAEFSLNLPNLTPIPSHFSEHGRMSTRFDGRRAKSMDSPLSGSAGMVSSAIQRIAGYALLIESVYRRTTVYRRVTDPLRSSVKVRIRTAYKTTLF